MQHPRAQRRDRPLGEDAQDGIPPGGSAGSQLEPGVQADGLGLESASLTRKKGQPPLLPVTAPSLPSSCLPGWAGGVRLGLGLPGGPGVMECPPREAPGCPGGPGWAVAGCWTGALLLFQCSRSPSLQVEGVQWGRH